MAYILVSLSACSASRRTKWVKYPKDHQQTTNKKRNKTVYTPKVKPIKPRDKKTTANTGKTQDKTNAKTNTDKPVKEVPRPPVISPNQTDPASGYEDNGDFKTIEEIVIEEPVLGIDSSKKSNLIPYWEADFRQTGLGPGKRPFQLKEFALPMPDDPSQALNGVFCQPANGYKGLL